MMEWQWSGGVERKANPLLRECWTFLIYIFLHQQWKQCLEFKLSKLREICKYLAGACNSNSHARGLHFYFCLQNKAGKINATRRVVLRKCIKRAQRYQLALKCKEVSLQIEVTTLPPKTTTSLWNLERKGNWRKRNCGHRLNNAQHNTQGGGGDVRKEWEEGGGGRGAPLHKHIY